jgi:uncharacterized protein YkwD
MPVGVKIRTAALGAVAAAALVTPSQALAAGCANANANPNDVSLKDARAATVCILNRKRRAHGLGALRENKRLDLASQRHANDMSAHNFFAHGDFVGRIKRARYLDGARSWTLGENIAWGSMDYATPASIVDSWMHSPPHRANILRGRFREIGLGIARGSPSSGQKRAGTYVTDFGARS